MPPAIPPALLALEHACTGEGALPPGFTPRQRDDQPPVSPRHPLASEQIAARSVLGDCVGAALRATHAGHTPGTPPADRSKALSDLVQAVRAYRTHSESSPVGVPPTLGQSSALLCAAAALRAPGHFMRGIPLPSDDVEGLPGSDPGMARWLTSRALMNADLRHAVVSGYSMDVATDMDAAGQFRNCASPGSPMPSSDLPPRVAARLAPHGERLANGFYEHSLKREISSAAAVDGVPAEAVAAAKQAWFHMPADERAAAGECAERAKPLCTLARAIGIGTRPDALALAERAAQADLPALELAACELSSALGAPELVASGKDRQPPEPDLARRAALDKTHSVQCSATVLSSVTSAVTPTPSDGLPQLPVGPDGVGRLVTLGRRLFQARLSLEVLREQRLSRDPGAFAYNTLAATLAAGSPALRSRHSARTSPRRGAGIAD